MFSEGVLRNIGFYVYRLIHPLTRETFYIGKGSGQRVFHHRDLRLEEANREGGDIDEPTGRADIIRELRARGLEPKVCIHRHGMTEEVALHVEATLIDAYPNLANAVQGHGSGSFGPITVEGLEEKYGLGETPLDPVLNYLLVFVNQRWRPGMNRDQVFRTAHYAWRVNPQRAESCDYVLAVSVGVVRGCFVAERWLMATRCNFPNYEPLPNRYGFEGIAAGDVWERYVPTRVPEDVLPQGRGPTSFCYWPRG